MASEQRHKHHHCHHYYHHHQHHNTNRLPLLNTLLLVSRSIFRRLFSPTVRPGPSSPLRVPRRRLSSSGLDFVPLLIPQPESGLRAIHDVDLFFWAFLSFLAPRWPAVVLKLCPRLWSPTNLLWTTRNKPLGNAVMRHMHMHMACGRTYCPTIMSLNYLFLDDRVSHVRSCLPFFHRE